MKSFIKIIFLSFAFLLGFLVSPASFAAAPDFSTLTDAVDYSTAITAILTVFAALAGVYIVMAGGSLILSKIRGGR